MAPEMALNIDSSLPLLSNTKLHSSPQEEKGGGPSNTTTTSAIDSKPAPIDTVSISSESRQAIIDVKKKEDPKKIEVTLVNSNNKPDQTVAKVDFVYDLKGELITKYMDSGNRLIYQTPSELMLRTKEAASKSNSSVSTKA